MEKLTEEHLPLLLKISSAISADWALYEAVPQVTACSARK